MSFVPRNHPQQVDAKGADDATDDRRTPDDLLAECMDLVECAAFDLDPCASDESTKAAFYYTIEEDGLAQDWWGSVWCNPPYSDLRGWVEKALDEEPNCDRIVMLLPANRTEQGFWQDLIEPRLRDGTIRVFFLRGRRRFDRPGWEKPKKGDRPPFGLCVLDFDCGNEDGQGE